MKLGVLVVLAAAGVASADLRATFDAGPQGWRIFDVGMSGHRTSIPPGVLATWESSTQSIRVTDQAGETCVGAPELWLGNRLSAYGHEISYDATFRSADNNAYSAVVLRGASMTLYCPAPRPTPNTTFRRVIPLVESGWHVNGDSGAAATAAQLREVLSDLRGLYIRTEWTTGADDTSIDNIRLSGVAGCVADVDDGSGMGTPDGGVTIDDLLYYLVLFDGGGVAADVDDGSGTGTLDGGVTIEDLLYFLQRFDAGC